MDRQELNEMGINDETIANAFFDLMWANKDRLTEEDLETFSDAYLTAITVIDMAQESQPLASGKGWVVANV